MSYSPICFYLKNVVVHSYQELSHLSEEASMPIEQVLTKIVSGEEEGEDGVKVWSLRHFHFVWFQNKWSP